MTLAIDHFVTRCRLSPRANLERGRIDRVVREEFPLHCARELASVFHGRTGVIRIRRLSLKLALARTDLGEVALGREWATTFAASLKRALALPDGRGPIELRRFADRADWLAAAIEAVLQGKLADRWELADFASLAALPLEEAVRHILDRDPGGGAAVLLRLRERGRLDELLINCDEPALERLMQRLDRESAAAVPLEIGDLLTVARLAHRHAKPGSGHLVSRHRALALWAELAGGEAACWTPRRIVDALHALDVLIAVFAAETGGDMAAQILHGDIAAQFLRRLTDDTVPAGARLPLAQVLRLVEAASADGRCRADGMLARLTEALTELAAVFPPPAAAVGKRIASEAAGLLLLVPCVIRLGWPQAMQATSLWARLGPRALAHVLAAMGEEILKKAGRDDGGLDPAVAVFAGWMELPDHAGHRRFVDAITSDECRELSQTLGVSSAAASDGAAGWPATIAAAADRIARDFASRIRGFAKSSPAFIVQKLLAVPGEVLIEDRRVSVALAPCPFHVALHVSSAFEGASAVGWLGYRDLVFHPGAR